MTGYGVLRACIRIHCNKITLREIFPATHKLEPFSAGCAAARPRLLGANTRVEAKSEMAKRVGVDERKGNGRV